MIYKPYFTQSESAGLMRSKKNALLLLANNKFVVHNIQVKNTHRIALCNTENEVLHIISRVAYQKYITPELQF